jgi:MYXO-CTERM domain-containing protein
VYTWVQSFSGTTTGSIDGVSGGSFAFQGATGQGVTNNGAQAVFSFDGSLWTALTFDFARRGTSTGFNNVTVEMFDGTTSLGVLGVLGAAGSSWELTSYDISALNGVADASIVFTFDGATSDTGNNRLDNVTINGTAIPAPGSVALIALGGLVGTRRRRA